ncbi:hypothetical protein HZC32_02510 [Candidatus Woesearchaeota archaeon]|nr:hypothetical protein [Candidatus Woesearchaeota archaeon]
MKSEELKLEGMAITPEQFVAMKLTREIGLGIKTQFPEVADDYRNGLFASQIVDKYSLDTVFQINKYIAQKAVGCAIRGFEGGMGIEAYKGLIEDDKSLEMLAQEHRQKCGEESGNRSFLESFGLYGLTLEEAREKNRRGGKTAGNKVYEDGKAIFGYASKEEMERQKLLAAQLGRESQMKNGTGIYGLTPEKRYLQGKKGGRKITELRGLTVWENGEEERVAELMENESFRKQWGERRCPDIEKIQRQINIEFHHGKEIRSVSAIKNIFNKIRKNK